jgi:hypothetical protein
VIALIPDQDAPGWTPLTAYAEDALSALAYSLQNLQNEDSQLAVWVAQRAYDSLDFLVTTRDHVDPNDRQAEARALADPLIQAEFARQARDIADITRAANGLSQALLDDLRARSIAEQAIPARWLS